MAFARVAVLSALLVASAFAKSDDSEAKNRPVSKVIELLKGMVDQLEKEEKQDKEIYENITDLTAKIEEYTATSSRLATEIKKLEKEVARNQVALDKATEIRQKELGEFNEEEKSSLQAISSLKSALTVLSKHQASASSLVQVAAALQPMMITNSVKEVLTGTERKAVAAFIQAAPEGNYSPASGQIFGILSQMRETFETNLSASQKEEMASQKAYEELKAAKEDEIAAGQTQIDTKTKELADTDAKLSQAKEDLEDTKASLAADEEFLLMLKEKCAQTDAEFEERTKTRAAEIEACSKALAFLSSDEAHDLFSKSFNFIQQESSKMSERRNKASNLLKAAAQKMKSPVLAALSQRVKLDAFEKVKKAIDDMIAQLLQDKADEIKHKDFCTDEFNTNKLQTEDNERTKSDLAAKIEDLELNIAELTQAIETLKSEIAEMQIQMKRAGEDREKENKVFQGTVADQKATQKLLQMALNVLAEFYGKAAAALVQKGKQAPPAGFDAYKKNESSGGVMGMIREIINDSKSVEAEAIRGEEDAQVAYETFVKDTNASIEEKNKDIANKSESKAQAEGDLVEANQSMEETEAELERLGSYKAELHASCDFVLKNFGIRQSGRDEEVAALRQAKAILSGAKFEQFLQKATVQQ
jgi:predicted RNase H-like nuclease (RuvC/YqgF family)